MAHDHSHDTSSGAARRRLGLVLAITATLAVAELVGGLRSHSLTLLADAGHMASDVAALGLALFAAWVADRPSPPHRTFGSQRAEILAALANAVLLAVVMISVVREAFVRLHAAVAPDPAPMFVLGVLGLAGNLAGVVLL